MKPAIRADNLSKRYRLGAARPDRNLSEAVRAGLGRAWGAVSRKPAPRGEEFWALRDVSFDVQPGEVVGVIGRNGAGKSTLLKVLARIVEPTAGRAEVRGRMGSLLEVGTGFHPELSGRENVYLSGSVLGMTRRETASKFDAIVAFSGVEQFIDTPVKRYSSGMYVRLAFAVAAHLEPEILVVDEVLAVGDATFQRRCVDRMTELARGGRTVLFVSHNMQLIPLLCERAVLLERGRVARVGPAGDVTRDYLGALLTDARAGDLRDRPRSGDGRARFVRAELVDASGNAIAAHDAGADLTLRIEIEASVPVPEVAVSVILGTPHGTRLVTAWTKESGHPVALRPGVQALTCTFRAATLRPGHTVLAHLWMSAGEVLDWVENAVAIEVTPAGRFRELSPDSNQGPVVFDTEWRQTPC